MRSDSIVDRYEVYLLERREGRKLASCWGLSTLLVKLYFMERDFSFISSKVFALLKLFATKPGSGDAAGKVCFPLAS